MTSTHISPYFALMDMRARVCMCVGLCSGIDSLALSKVVGLQRKVLTRDYLTELVRLELVGKCRKGRQVTYHSRKAGDRYVREEQARIARESLDFIGAIKGSGRAKMEEVAILERALLGE